MSNPINVKVHKEATIESVNKCIELHISNNNMITLRIKYDAAKTDVYEDTMSFNSEQAAELGMMFEAAAREAGYKVKRQPRGTAAAAKKAAKK